MPRLRLIQRLRFIAQATALIAIIYFIFRYLSSPSPRDAANKIKQVEDSDSKYYSSCQNINLVKYFNQRDRLVHLDLKGAPPKMSYFERVFPLMREMGATGLLIEYEDTFPYEDELKVLSSKNAYSKKDIIDLLKLAKSNQLTTVIPLVQTFGHMEFVLKHKIFAELRENPDDIRSIAPNDEDSLSLIQKMIDQVASLHPNSHYFHIGADEVFGLGKSKKSKDYMKKENINTVQLYLRHVEQVAEMVAKRGYKVLAWDDMFRTTANIKQLKASKIHKLIEPVVWLYEPHPENYIPSTVWTKYTQVFQNVWIASAFKGATGENQYITNMEHHMTNNHNWVKIIQKHGFQKQSSGVTNFNIRGTILTGWQRYDHKRPLCELLPVALPSLAFNTQLLKFGCFTREMHQTMSVAVLRCQRILHFDLLQEVSAGSDSQCSFPGRDIFYGVHALYALDRGYPPVVVKRAALSASMKKHLTDIYDEDSISEWLDTVKL